MAKALVGHLAGPSSEHVRQTATLRRRVADLEAEVGRLKTENDALAAALAERVESVLLDSASH